MTNPFLGEDTSIPMQDIRLGLPIRWAAHSWASLPNPPGWLDMPGGFNRWREYLSEAMLETGEIVKERRNGIDLMIEFLRSDECPAFPESARQFLVDNKAETLAGFIPFYLKCLKEYELLLKRNNSFYWFFMRSCMGF